MSIPESPTLTDAPPRALAVDARRLPPHTRAHPHLQRAARATGAAYLVYIAVAFPGMLLSADARRGDSTAARLARIAGHLPELRLAVVLALLGAASALVLAVALYRLTRDHDADLARLALICRVGEGILGALGVVPSLGLAWLATGGAAVTVGGAPGVAAADALAAFLLEVGAWSGTLSATFFAAGSTLFSYLLLRGRTVPLPLAWVGIVASALLMVALPAQLVGILTGPVTGLIWLPMLVFEVPLGLWLLVRGVAVPISRERTSATHADAATLMRGRQARNAVPPAP